MPYADYQCTKCNHVTLFNKKYNDLKKEYDDFPATIKCEKCKNEATRVYGDIIMDLTYSGKVGNSKDGFNNNYTETYSTMLGKIGKSGAKTYKSKKD